MRNLSEQEIELVSGAGDGGTEVLIGANSVIAGAMAFSVGLVLVGSGPIGWAVAAGIVVAGGTGAGQYYYYSQNSGA